MVLPEFPSVDKNDFIENKLLRAVHLTKKPYDMLEVCREIIRHARNGSDLFDDNDVKLSKLLSRAIKFVNVFDEKAFRIYTKGYGVVCME